MSHAEPALPDAIRAGDPQAFEDLVRRNTPRLLSVTRRILKNDDEARDAVQQAFVAAFKSREQFHAESLPSTWLHRIAVNKALDLMRARQRRHEDSIEDLLPRFLPNGHHTERFAVWPEPIEERIDRDRQAASIREAIDVLPDTFRIVLLLRDIEEMSTEETAQALGITPNAVKLRLHRARMALRTLLADRMKAAEIQALKPLKEVSQ
jgi:RNA polymerase sigma-70 factor (ECF subfamily)